MNTIQNNLRPRWTRRNGAHLSKTQKDRSSGSHARCIRNKLTRAAWNNEKTMLRHNGATGVGAFPYHTCNGKRNRGTK